STLVLFVLLSAWAVLRAAETGQLRWLLLSAALVGLGFNIKMLEAYLVVPALGLVYLLGTRKSLWRRLGNLFLALIVMVAISLSWATAVDLTAASQRPWVDSTTTNSEIDLAIGYNGLQRLTGNHSVSGTAQSSQPAGGAGASGTLSTRSTSSRGTSTVQGSTGGNGPGGGNGGPGGVGENGPTGVFRLLDTQLGSQIGWFLPLAILGFLIAFWQTRPRFRILDDRQRALVLWGAWLLTTGAFFSVALFYHTYYLVMVAPAISALAGIGIVSLWQEYRRRGSRMWWTLPLSLLIAGGIEARILSSYPSWSSWLTPLVVAACVLAAIALIVFRLRPLGTMRLAVAPAVVAVLALMAPATTFAAYTMQHTQTGAILRAGPTASGTANGQGGFGGPGGGFGGPPSNGSSRPNNAPPTSPNGNGATGQAGPGAFGPPPGANTSQGTGSRAQFGSGFGQGGNGGPGGQTSSALIKYLVSHRGTAKYLVATPSSNEASPIIIATGDPVMSLGGFTGSDPILTTAKLASLTKQGVVRYFLLGGGGPAGSNSLTSWIQQHSKVISVGGTQLYEYTG
ncbi:MAG TPA: glycosyltransferase family 39 protein, partial [Chloroflexota bacterium]